MTCDQTQPLLEAFADEELGWWAAWRVRRHLAACPACASEVAELQRLTARIRAWRDVPAPAHLQSQIAAALPPAPPVSAPRRPIAARRAAVGLAGLAAAAAAFFWLLPGQPGRPTIAFADVEQAMQQVQTVSYDMNSHCYDAQGRVVPSGMSFSFRNWLRRKPAASARYDAVMHEQHLEDARGSLWYSRRLNKYLKQPLVGDNIEQSVNKEMHHLTEPPTSADMDTAASQPAPSVQLTVTHWQQHEANLNGIVCQKFTRDILRITKRNVLRTTYGGYEDTDRHDKTHVTIWADARTLHVVRVELTGDAAYMARGYREHTVLDDFHYNETPPPGVFDWSPPPRAKVEGHW